MNFRWAKIRIARGVFSELLTQPFEFATANVGEILSRRRRCRALVEVHGDLELLADALSKLARESDAVLHRRPLERNERHDVRRANARVLSRMLAKIDALRGRGDSGKGRVYGALDGRDEGYHRSVVRSIRRDIED